MEQRIISKNLLIENSMTGDCPTFWVHFKGVVIKKDYEEDNTQNRWDDYE